MYKFTYTNIEENEDPTEIAFHNMKVGEETYSLATFLGGQQGYFYANPNNTFQDLELELRKRNFNTHIIAKFPSVSITDGKFKLGSINKNCSVVTNEIYKFEAITSCRPKEYALQELLETWNSYEENFEALKEAGTIIVISDKITEKDLNESVIDGGVTKLVEKENPVNLMSVNKIKIVATKMKSEEIISNITKQIVEKKGKEPVLKLYAMSKTGGPIMVMTIDNKIVSNVGICIEHDVEGKQIVNLVTLTN